ncbi:MAG: UDP-N-acetylmuramate--L-alanine ligase [Bacteriovoracales bacterium]|nr:UDP-N-acetylmuramate--L-alanine ligase [Bacteriovoracales bacterium]
MFKDKKDIKLHFIGIGGIGMSGIAKILLMLGYRVSGSDLEEGNQTLILKNLGADIFIGHHKSNIDEKTKVVVYSSAIKEENPEIKRAKELQIPLLKRAEMLAEIMRLKYGIAVSGTHGKTTTSSMLATIMYECDIDLTHIIGGVVQNLGDNAKLGKSQFILVEADESDGSFLMLNPVLSIITNIDNDHLDYYKSKEKIFESFLEFSNKIPFYGHNALNIHDKNICKLMTETSRPYLTYGIDRECDYCAKNLKTSAGKTKYDLYFKNQFVRDVTLNMPGRHNVLNSLGAISIAHQIIPDLSPIAQSISKFQGVGRRFEIIYESNGLTIVDDYGHHPTEIKETISSAKEFKKDQLVILYEPHRFSRTQDCWDQFIECLQIPDKIFLLPIYPAGEPPISGITSYNLSLNIPNAEALNDFNDMENVIKRYTNTKTLLLTMGAGRIGLKIRELVKEFH